MAHFITHEPENVEYETMRNTQKNLFQTPRLSRKVEKRGLNMPGGKMVQ